MRGGVVAFTDLEERIVHSRKVARQNQRSYARAVRLESDGDDIAHQTGVLAQIFRQAVLRTLHGEGGAVRLLRQVIRLILGLAHALDAFFYFTHAGEILVQLGFVAGADFAAERYRAIFHAIENADIAQTTA